LPSTLAGQDFAALYEQLRRDVLGKTSRSSLGLILFLRRGMAAWMEASSSCSLPPPTTKDPTGPSNALSPLPIDVRSQAAIILAGILLHSRSETTL
jgi:hypothetical protein